LQLLNESISVKHSQSFELPLGVNPGLHSQLNLIDLFSPSHLLHLSVSHSKQFFN